MTEPLIIIERQLAALAEAVEAYEAHPSADTYYAMLTQKIESKKVLNP